MIAELLKKKFAYKEKLSPFQVCCEKRLQTGNKIVSSINEVPQGSQYEVFDINTCPECFSFSVAFSIEGRKSKYIKRFEYANKEEAEANGWIF